MFNDNDRADARTMRFMYAAQVIIFAIGVWSYAH
jgi:hypothetical protein